MHKKDGVFKHHLFLKGDKDKLCLVNIEKIEKDKFRKDRYWIYMEDGEKISLHAHLVIKYNLKSGKEITKEQLKEWKREDEFQKSFDAALNYLSYRPRSKKEMSSYLYRKGFSVEAIESSIHKLEKYGYIDDLNFADSWMKARLNSRPMSKRMIAQELYQKGIKKDIIEQALQSVDEGKEEKAAFSLAKKYLKRYEGLEQRKRFYKIGQALARRGFEWELIQRVCRKLTIQEQEE